MISCLVLLMSRTISRERPSKMSSSSRAQLAPELAEHREAGVDAAVQDLVQQPAGAAGKELVAHLGLVPDPFPHGGERHDRLLRQGHHVVGTDEDVQLDRMEPPGVLVEARELQHQEQVVVVDVQLWPLVDAGDVLQVERVERELLRQPGEVRRSRILGVVPAQPARLDHLDPRLVRHGAAVAVGPVTGDASAGAVAAAALVQRTAALLLRLWVQVRQLGGARHIG